MNRACYPINTQMNSNICNASIFTNSFISSLNNRVRIQDENHKKQINTCLIKEDNGIYWYIYKFCVIICIKLNSSSLQVLYLYKRGELLMNQRKEKTEVKYMQTWEERIMIKQEGIAEGRIEGEKALLKSLIEKKMAKKYSAEQISAMLEVDVSEVENIMKEIQNEKNP